MEIWAHEILSQRLAWAMRAHIPGLIEAGAIEAQGRGRGVRYHLCRALDAAMRHCISL